MRRRSHYTLALLVVLGCACLVAPAARAAPVPVPPPAARTTVTLITGDEVTVTALPDGKPGISVRPLPCGSAAFATESGRVLLDWPGIIGIVLSASGPSGDYSLTYDQTAQGAWNSRSQTSHSEWTFHSTRPEASAVPAAWRCPDHPGYCAAVPLLVANYALP